MLTVEKAYNGIVQYFSAPDAVYGMADVGLPSQHCVYRTVDGNKCAVGSLIPKSKYRKEFDENGYSVETVIEKVFGRQAVENDDLIVFLEEAQVAHDSCANQGEPMGVFLDRLAKVAAKYGVEV